MRLAERPTFRKWLGEVTNIVLGVLIALGLGAVATEIAAQMDAAAARGSLADELGEAVGQANLRVRLSPCVNQRLDQIGRILDRASATGRIPAVGMIGAAPWYTWSTNVWRNVVSTETASHLSLDEQRGYGGAYGFLDALDHSNRQELDAWTDLYGLIGPGRSVTPDELARFRSAQIRARFLNNFIAVNSVRFAQVGDAYKLRFNQDVARPNRTADLSKSRFCKPIVPYAGEAYGMAPMNAGIANALANPITRDNPR